MSTYVDSTSPVPTVPGVKVLSGKALTFQKSAVLVITLLPFIGLVLAVWSLWGWGLSGVDAGIFLGTYIFSGLGVTVGFHRLLTHKSFETKPWLRSLLAIAGSLAIEGSVISWVAAHRRHHAFSDREAIHTHRIWPRMTRSKAWSKVCGTRRWVGCLLPTRPRWSGGPPTC